MLGKCMYMCVNEFIRIKRNGLGNHKSRNEQCGKKKSHFGDSFLI